MKNNKLLEDTKIVAMMTILDDIKFYPYEVKTKKKILTCIENHAINYLINELPEGLSYKEYCNKLDDYIVDLVKKEI